MAKVAGVFVFLGLWTVVAGQAEVHVRSNERRLIAPTTEDYGQSRMYIVHMSRSLAHDDHDAAIAKYTQLLQAVKAQDAALPLHVYHTACHGFSAHMTSQEAEALRLVDGVLAVLPDNEITLHTTHTPEFLNMTTVRGIWPDGRFGEDVIVGVIDSGVWPESSSFSDAGMGPVPARWKGICETGEEFNSSQCNKKLIGARYFYAGFEKKYNISLDSATGEFKSARDADGHGTHTASTAAGSPVSNANMFGSANGTARGMAPKARIAVYKVGWFGGGVADSDVLAAIDQAVADGVDIINLSLSVPVGPYPQSSIEIGAFGAMKHGVFVSCSGGNNGSFGLGTVKNIAPWVMTVAASTVDRTFPANVQLGDGQILSGVSLYQLEGGQVSQLITGANATAGNATESARCMPDSLNSALVKGKIVVCEADENSSVEKGAAVMAAGGAGMIITNPVALGEIMFADPHYLPASHVGAKARTTILAYMNATANPTAKLQLLGTQLGVTPAPVVAFFSSRGPNPLTPQVLKPDITAPGVNILAAWTGAVGPNNAHTPDTRKVDFNIMSGTSMSCPHIAGLAALLKAAHPDWSPSAIKSAMMTTATINGNFGGGITDELTSLDGTPFLYGSGHVRPERALDPGLVYDMTPQDYVNFLCAVNVTAKEILLFTHNETAHCPQSPVRVEDMNYPSFSAVFQDTPSLSPVSVNMSRTVTNVGNGTATYTAQVYAPAGINITVEPDVLRFNARNETRRFTVRVTTVNSPDSGIEASNVPSFAYLVWTDEVGVHSVQSPIAVTMYK